MSETPASGAITSVETPSLAASPLEAAASLPASEVMAPAANIPAAETVSAPGEVASAAASAAEAPKADALSNVMGDTGEAPKPEAAAADAKPDAKVTETKPETPPEGAPEAVKAEAPTYEIKFPDGVTVAKEPLEAFQRLFGEIETGKLDHKGFNEKAQTLADMHVKAVNETIERYTDSLVQMHETQKTEWFDGFKKDPEIGGERVGETVKNVRAAIDYFGGSKDQIAELRGQMKESGYGNYVPLLRLINNMQTKINSYTTEKTGGIVPGSAPAPVKVKDYQRFYGGSQ